MQIFQSLDGKSFNYNSRRYVKNFIVIKLGSTHIAVLGAYDSKLQLLGSTHYSEVKVDEIVYPNQQALMNALSIVVFAKGSSSGGSFEQNNSGLFLTNFQHLIQYTGDSIEPSEIANRMNLLSSFIVSETQTPVLFQFTRNTNGIGDGVTVKKKYIFLFLGGKGIWGANNTPVTATQFKLLFESNLTVSDISDDPNNVINALGEVADGDFVTVANTNTWDFFDTDKTYYFSYIQDNILYLVAFTGTPGLYGLGNVPLVEDDFTETTNSDIDPVIIPTLEQVTTQGNTTTKELIVANKITATQFVKQGGAATQFLKADGSVDANTYATQTALNAKVTDTITDGITTIAPSQNAVYDALVTKQSNLISGTNIRTIEGQSLLGSGNINLEKGDIGLPNVDNTSDINKPISTATQTALNLKINTSIIGQPNGIASLDINNKVPLSQMNDSLIGNVTYKGLYNGTNITSSPDASLVGQALPTASTGNKGWYFIAITTFTNVGNGYATGDWIISNATQWDKVDNTDAVSSVNGKVGVVTVTKTDVGLANVDNTSDVNKPISTATQTALDGKQSNLVSGTNIKTIEGQSLVGSGNIDLGKVDVGLSNVDNTSDVNKPISTATQTALNLKANDSNVVHKTGETSQTVIGKLIIRDDVGVGITSTTPTAKFQSYNPDTVLNKYAGIFNSQRYGVAIFGSIANTQATDFLLNIGLATGVEAGTGVTSKFVVLGSGDVGIGMATPLDRFQSNYDVAGVSKYAGSFTSVRSGVKIIGSTTTTVAADNLLAIGRAAAPAGGTITTGDFVIKGNGNTLLNSTSDSGEKLQVNGTVRISGNTIIGTATNPNNAIFKTFGIVEFDSSAATLARYQLNGTAFGYIGMGNFATSGGTNTAMGIGAVTDLQFGAGNNYRMSIKSSGNVTIGHLPTVDNGFKLQVNGNVYFNGSGAFNGRIAIHDGTNEEHAATVGQVNAKVSDTITDGVTTVAPSQNAVYDALATAETNVATNYIPKTGAVTKVGAMTFSDAPIVPTATSSGNAVNLGQMNDQITNSIAGMMAFDYAGGAYTSAQLNALYGNKPAGFMFFSPVLGDGIVYIKVFPQNNLNWRRMALAAHP